jgi:ketosteroid isomerase-like protein
MSGGTQSDLEQRIQRLEDIEAIKRLKMEYATACDRNYDAAAVAELFVEDAVWESNVLGTYQGRAEIYDFIDGSERETPWIVHIVTNARIDVAPSGENATGAFSLLEISTVTDEHSAEGGDSVVSTATYEDTFVKHDGRWYFQRVIANWHQISNLDPGWARQRFRGATA